MRKFKRALSSVLAFVMVISIVTVMNLSNVFAEVSANSTLNAISSNATDYIEWTKWNFDNAISAEDPKIGGNVATKLGSAPTLDFVNCQTNYNVSRSSVNLTAPHNTYTTDSTYKAIKTSNNNTRGITISNAFKAGKGYSSYNLIITISSHCSNSNHSDIQENLGITLYDGNDNKGSQITSIKADVNKGGASPGQVTFSGLTAENIYFTIGAGNVDCSDSSHPHAQGNIYGVTLDYVEAEPSVTLNTNAEEIAKNDSIDLEAAVVNIPDVATATWSEESDDNDAVEIAPDGNKCTVTVKETAEVGQTATIKATADEYSATATITVRDAINKTWDFNDESWRSFSFEGSAESATSTVKDGLTVGFVNAASGKTISTSGGILNLGGSSSCYFEYKAPGDGTLVYSIKNPGIDKENGNDSVSSTTPRTIKINNGDALPYTSTGEYNYYTQIVELKRNETYKVQGGSGGFHLAALQFIEKVATVTEPETGIIQTTKDLGKNREGTMPSSNVGVYYDANEDSYYAVSVIPGNDIANYSQVKQKSGQKEVASSDTVYKKVSIDNTEKTAKDFGGNESDYVYASKITGATGVGADILVKAITSVLVPVEG